MTALCAIAPKISEPPRPEYKNFLCIQVGRVNAVGRTTKALSKEQFTTSPPAITLTGDWLAEAGFKAGDQYQVEVFNKQLLITHAETQAF